MVGLTVDCEWAGPVARFYEGSSDSRSVTLALADDGLNCSTQNGGVHLNIQGDTWYQPPTWPQQSGELTKTFHMEVEVDDLEAAITRALELGGTVAP